MEYEKLSIVLLDTAKIAFVVGLLVYLIRKMLPDDYWLWLMDRPFIVNIFVILASVGLSFLGGWLNLLTFQAREIVEYIYFGLFSAGISTLGYEFQKNWRKEIARQVRIEDEEIDSM